MMREAFRVHEASDVVLKRGIWSEEEDRMLISYINRFGIWNWSHMPRAAGLARTAKSCRLRWMNYLRPDIRHGDFTKEEVATIVEMQNTLGNRWAAIAAVMPGRTDNDIKNFWNSHLKNRVHDGGINTDVPQHDESESLSHDMTEDIMKEEASECTGLPSYEHSTTSDGVTAGFDQKEVQTGDLERMNECSGVLFQEDFDSWATTGDMAGLGSPYYLPYHEFEDPYDFCQVWPQDSFCPGDDVVVEDFSIDLWQHSP